MAILLREWESEHPGSRFAYTPTLVITEIFLRITALSPAAPQNMYP